MRICSLPRLIMRALFQFKGIEGPDKKEAKTEFSQ